MPSAQRLLDNLWRDRSGAVSTQVLTEFYAVVTRKFDPPMARRKARDLVGAYAQWRLVVVDVPMILAASGLEERHVLSFWDALIVEAAHRAGATRLFTENLQAGRSFVGVAIENPFTSTRLE